MIKCVFYTGIPTFNLLMIIFNFVAPYVANIHKNALSKFPEFMLCLMRLRLNLTLQDLAYRFNVSRSTSRRIFHRWLDVLNVRIGKLVLWPDRDVIRRNMPLDFYLAFKRKVTVIIDCFEVFSECPSSYDGKAMTYSMYKSHNTVKFLIGITPQGTVSFISRGWGGRTSDKYITEHCGILDLLLPGDLILADRGFNITDTVGLYAAKVALPAFTRGSRSYHRLSWRTRGS